MSKKIKSILYNLGRRIALFALISLLVAGAAHAVAWPSNAVINPVNQTVYVPSNNASRLSNSIKIYVRSAAGWTEVAENKIILPSATARTYGMAVSQDGSKLIVSINNSSSSKLRIYNLNSYGLYTGSYTDADWSPYAFYEPAAIAVVENRVYMANSNYDKVHYFDHDPASGNWEHTGDITEGIDGLSNIYGVATSQPGPNGNYFIYLSRKTDSSNGQEIFVYEYVDESIVFRASIDAVIPTYLKVVGNRLYASLNGTSGDIGVYDISTSSPYITEAGIVSSIISGAYGCTGFDISPNGEWLVYTQAHNESATLNGIYKVAIADIDGGTSAEFVQSFSEEFDGLVFSIDQARVALTHSGDGSIHILQSSAIDDSLSVLAPEIDSINSIIPNKTTYGTSVDVIINGNNFVNNAEMRTIASLDDMYNPQAPTYNLKNLVVVSPTQLSATVSGTLPDAGLHRLIVRNQDLNPDAPNNSAQVELDDAFTINFTPPANLAGQADDASGSPIPGGRIRWTWDLNEQGEDHYALKRENNSLVDEIDYPEDSYIETTNLNKNTQYSRKVVVYSNGNHVSTESALVSAYSSAQTPSALNLEDDGSSVTLSWANGGNPAYTRYEVSRRAGTVGSFTNIATVTAASHIDENVSGGTTYYYRVRALNEQDYPTNYSGTESITVSLGNQAPEVPTDLEQYRSDEETVISHDCGKTNLPVVLKFMMSDPNSPDTLTPLVRAIESNGDTAVNAEGSSIYYVNNPVEGIVTLDELKEGTYTWEARVSDEAGELSDWIAGYCFEVDTTPPVVSSTSPEDNGSADALDTVITVTFNEDMDPDTIDDETIIVRENGYSKAVSVSYDPATFTATITPETDFKDEANVQARVRSGSNGVRDIAGNQMESDYIFNFKVSTGTVQTITIIEPHIGVYWAVGQTYAISWESTGDIEHVQIEFSPDSGTHWFEIENPVANTGSYDWLVPENAESEIVLIMVSDAQDKDPSAQSDPFHVYVDNKPPKLIGVDPQDEETGVAVDTNIIATFSDEYGLNPDMVTENTFYVEGLNPGDFNIQYEASGTIGDVTSVLTLVPVNPFAEGEVVTVHLIGGANGIQDYAGNVFETADYSWSFTVGISGPAPTVTSIDPNNGVQGEDITIVNLVGANLADGAQVELRNGAETIQAENETTVDAEHISCSIALPINAAEGAWDVVVINPDFQEGLLEAGFTVQISGAETTPPAAIDDLLAYVGDTTGTIRITWTAVADDGNDPESGPATSYTIYYQYADEQPADLSNAEIYTPAPTPATPGTLEDLVMDLGLGNAGKKIWLTVRAADEVSNTSEQGNWAVTIVKNYIDPPVITKVYPTKAPNDQINHIVIEGENLYNDMIANIVSYDGSVNVALTNVHQDSDKMVQADIPVDAALVVGVYEITITCPGGTYDDAVHENPNNDFEMITPGSDVTAPALIAGFTASDDQSGVINLSWTNPADNDLRELIVLRKQGSYPIDHADATADVAYQTLIPEPGAAFGHPDTNVQSGITYFYAVFSRDTSGNWNDIVTIGSNADTGEANDPDAIAPAAIEDLSAAVGTEKSTIRLNWTAVADDGNDAGSGPATSYIIYYQFADAQPADINSAQTYIAVPTPGEPGAAEELIMNLGEENEGNKVWVTMRAADEVPNTSEQGNWAVTIVKDNVNPPIITNIYPTKGPNDIINHIVIIGENLYNDMTANIVSYDGATSVALTNVKQIDDKKVEADIPEDTALVAGQYEIAISCPGGTYDDAAHANADNDFEMITSGSDTTAPVLVADFTASNDEDGLSTLTWTNPADNDLREVIVLRKEGSYPIDHADAAASTAYQTMVPEPGAAVDEYVDQPLNNGTTYYYAVFSRDTSDNWNDTVTEGSNADTGTPQGGTVENPEISLIFNPEGGNIYWISIPYNTPYVTASDLVAAINTQNGLAEDSGEVITSVGRWIGPDQLYGPYDYLELLGGWSGSNFEITPGEALYLNIAADVTFTLEGSHDPSFIFNLPFDAERGNIFWISLPYNGNYTDAASVIADLNTSAGLPADSGDLVTSIGKWNGETQSYEPYDYLVLLGGWQGTNYTFQPGEGYYLNIAGDVNSWSPAAQ